MLGEVTLIEEVFRCEGELEQEVLILAQSQMVVFLLHFNQLDSVPLLLCVQRAAEGVQVRVQGSDKPRGRGRGRGVDRSWCWGRGEVWEPGGLAPQPVGGGVGGPPVIAHPVLLPLRHRRAPRTDVYAMCDDVRNCEYIAWEMLVYTLCKIYYDS